MDLFQSTYNSPLGLIQIFAEHSSIVEIKFSEDRINLEPNEVTEMCVQQLDEYFNGNLKSFDLPLEPKGTDFQKSVWQSLLNIPYGKSISYKLQAQGLNNPKAIRAIAAANGQNPIAIIIPCHRVLGSDGSLTGYASGLDKKRRLLELEGVLQMPLF